MFSTPHTADTENPQTYAEHWRVAFFGSLKLIWYGLAGLVHAFLPEIKALQFYTSSGIIRAYRTLENSRRHDAEIQRYFGSARLMVVQVERSGRGTGFACGGLVSSPDLQSGRASVR